MNDHFTASGCMFERIRDRYKKISLAPQPVCAIEHRSITEAIGLMVITYFFVTSPYA